MLSIETFILDSTTRKTMRTRCSIKVFVYHKIGKASSYYVIREVSMVNFIEGS